VQALRLHRICYLDGDAMLTTQLGCGSAQQWKRALLGCLAVTA
jgi:hypothetical protein